jgi:Zn-dependent peptidase ImmA (M78 family)
MDRQQVRPELEAERVLEQARSEYGALGEEWNNYQIDVDLLGTLLFDLGIQRVADLRVGERSYAGFLDPKARLIGIEMNHHEHRQRFSIAHEIGHYVLHAPQAELGGLFACTSGDMEISRFSNGRRSLHQRQEYEANQFASALLMPHSFVQAMYKVTGGRLMPLAKHFKVSAKAMEIRLERLHLPLR